MLKADENERLTQVGPGTPMGEVFRRYWLPACLSSELEAGGANVPVRLLGEDLVAFRSPDGSVGVMDSRCPHRGASLVIARNEECGLRCIYHGWKMDRDGRLVDVPTSRDPERLASIITQPAYPAIERGGLVWTNLGQDPDPATLPGFKWFEDWEERAEIVKVFEMANWAQGMESLVDSAHVNYLHADAVVSGETETAEYSGDKQVRNTTDGAPDFEVEDTPYGFRYAALREPLTQAETHKYVRTTVFKAPCFVYIASPEGRGHMEMHVPVDDERSVFYSIHFSTDGPFDESDRYYLRDWYGVRPGADIDEHFMKTRHAENGWLQDRERMRKGELFTGLRGIMNEDQAVVESMGPIVDRTREHLGPTDVAVIHLRRLMLRAASKLERGEAPVGATVRGTQLANLDAEEGLVADEVGWRKALSDGYTDDVGTV